MFQEFLHFTGNNSHVEIDGRNSGKLPRDLNPIHAEVHKTFFDLVDFLVFHQVKDELTVKEGKVVNISRLVVPQGVFDRHPKKSIESNDNDLHDFFFLTFDGCLTDFRNFSSNHRRKIKLTQFHQFDVVVVHQSETLLLIKTAGSFHFLVLTDQRFEGDIRSHFLGHPEEIRMEIRFDFQVIAHGTTHVINDIAFEFFK